jgi:hypothetical protein
MPIMPQKKVSSNVKSATDRLSMDASTGLAWHNKDAVAALNSVYLSK